MTNLIKKFIDLFNTGYELFVSVDSGDRHLPTIVLLHGIAATSKTYENLVNIIDTSKYRVIALDLLGFGQSPKPKNIRYSVDDHIWAIQNTLNKLGVKKPFVLAGHSMGSIIAAHYTHLYPHNVRKLFLLSLPLYKTSDKSPQTIISRKQTDVYLAIFDYMAQQKDITIKVSQKIKKYLKINDGMDVSSETWNSFRLSLKNTVVNQNTYEDISSITCPIKIIYGTLDSFLVMANIDNLADNSNIRITKIVGAHHSINHKFAAEIYNQIDLD